MTNGYSCLEIQELWRWGILSETNPTVRDPFCSLPQTIPWLLFPRAVCCVVGWWFLHSNQASTIVIFLLLTLNSLGSSHSGVTANRTKINRRTAGWGGVDSQIWCVCIVLPCCDQGNPIKNFLLLPRKQPCEQAGSESQGAKKLFQCFYQPDLLLPRA